MVKIDFEEFYHGWPNTKPIAVEKYFFDEGNLLTTRQMTYSFDTIGETTGIEPTFEVNDVILCQGTDEVYVIIQIGRTISEVYTEILDKKMKRTGKYIWLEDNEIYHKLKDVEWINAPD